MKYPELYPEGLVIIKKTQDKTIQKIDEIIEICRTPKSIVEIMEALGYKSSKTLKRNYIKPLLEKGSLQMTIPEKPTSRNQRYISIRKEK